MDDPSIRLSYSHADVDLDVVHGFLSQTYWSPDIRRDVTERAVERSCVVVALHAEGGRERQVGFLRIVTDGATFAWVCDVFVLEAFRGRGIARRMLAAADRHPEITSTRRWLLATRDAHHVYARAGYTPLAVPDRWMERVSDPAEWKRPPEA